jgi:hypothetical protein
VQHHLSSAAANLSYWLQLVASESTHLQLAAMLLAGLWYVAGAWWMHGAT